MLPPNDFKNHSSHNSFIFSIESALNKIGFFKGKSKLHLSSYFYSASPFFFQMCTIFFIIIIIHPYFAIWLPPLCCAHFFLLSFICPPFQCRFSTRRRKNWIKKIKMQFLCKREGKNIFKWHLRQISFNSLRFSAVRFQHWNKTEKKSVFVYANDDGTCK